MGAGRYSSLPGCDAVTLQVPTASAVSVTSLTAQMPGVVEAYPTGRPELAMPPKTRLEPTRVEEGRAKVMVWATGSGGGGSTVVDACTFSAGAYTASPAWTR